MGNNDISGSIFSGEEKGEELLIGPSKGWKIYRWSFNRKLTIGAFRMRLFFGFTQGLRFNFSRYPEIRLFYLSNKWYNGRD
jgi:hypothetical protein